MSSFPSPTPMMGTSMRQTYDTSKRGLLHSGALMTAGVLAGCALPGSAANVPATPFNVPDTYIPVAGSDQMFPVRRIYCIGRNYAAHAI